MNGFVIIGTAFLLLMAFFMVSSIELGDPEDVCLEGQYIKVTDGIWECANLSGVDLDNVCSQNNATLIRVNGVWACGLLNESTFNINISSFTFISINESDPIARILILENNNSQNAYWDANNDTVTNYIDAGDYWTRTGTTLSPTNSGDNLAELGNVTITLLSFGNKEINITNNLGVGFPIQIGFFAPGRGSSGFDSISLGNDCLASGYDAMAIGATAQATADGTVAFGTVANANAENGMAIGAISEADGISSTAIGVSAVAGGQSSFAIGGVAIANGEYSLAFGDLAQADGDYGAVAMSSLSTASGESSTALGYWSTASGDWSTAIGAYCQATLQDQIVMCTTDGAYGSVPQLDIHGGTADFQDNNINTTGTGLFGTLTLGSGSITDSSGTINFGDENLITTGYFRTGNYYGTVDGDLLLYSDNNLFLDLDNDNDGANRAVIIRDGANNQVIKMHEDGLINTTGNTISSNKTFSGYNQSEGIGRKGDIIVIGDLNLLND